MPDSEDGALGPDPNVSELVDKRGNHGCWGEGEIQVTEVVDRCESWQSDRRLN